MPSPNLNSRRFILPAIAVIGLLAIIAYTALPMLLGAWLRHQLAAQGFTHLRLELGYPGLHVLRIQRLEMTRQAGHRRFEFSARHIRLDYQFADLVTGRIRALHVPEAILRVALLPSGEAVEPQPMAMPLPGEWLRAIPFQELIVDRLQIHWDTGNNEARMSLHGRAERTPAQFLTRWTLLDKNQPFLEFEMALSSDGTLNAALFRPAAPSPPLLRAGITVTPRDNQTVAMDGSLEAQLKPLAALLALWLPEALLPLDGHLQVRWKGKAPAILPAPTTGGARDRLFNGVLSVDLSRLQMGTQLQAGRLHLKAVLSTHDNSVRWRLEDSVLFSARLDPALFAFGNKVESKETRRTSTPTTVQGARGLSGELVFAAPEWHLIFPPRSEILIKQWHTPDARIEKLIVVLLETARFIYQPRHGQWKSAGLAVSLTAPVIRPQLAAVGNIENLTLTAKLAAGLLSPLPALEIENADMSILGGRVSGARIHYDRARAANSFTLEIKGLDLARVVALEQQQQIEASGTLDGRLPLILTPTGTRIVDGELHATPAGGVIRYHATESIQSMAAANPNLKLALQAFSNYHYRKLDVGVNYAENGDLALAVAVTGRNPDWNAGQPINLNINIAENIPMLLRSLRSGDDIGRQFQNRANERSSPKP